MFGDLVFRKSSYSGAANNCVEVADVGPGALVRDSKQPDRGPLSFTSAEWHTFVSSLKTADTIE